MSITDYNAGRCRACRRAWCLGAIDSLLLDVPDDVTGVCVRAAKEEHDDIQEFMLCSRAIRTTHFNINLLSERECLGYFRFKKRNINRICDLINYEAVKIRNQYSCDKLTATYLFLHQCATPVRWKDMELRYGIFESRLSEVFW